MSSIPFYPFLIALFPILSFYSENISEVSLDAIVNPMLIVTLITILLFTFLSMMFNNREKAGVLTSIFLILFFSYGHLLNLIDFQVNLGIFSIGENKALYTVYSLILIIVTYILIKYKGNLQNIIKLLSIFSIVLVSFSIFNIVSYEVREGRFPASLINLDSVSEKPLIKLRVSTKKPDIYYLIFDRYASNSTLKKYYNFDNSEFTSYLTNKGFYVASTSVSNYPITDQSLASSLNMEYINYLVDRVGKNSSDRTVVYPMLKDYKIWRLLKSNGYKFFHVGPLWEPTRVNEFADSSYSGDDNPLNLDEFSTKLLDTTIVAPITSNFLGKTSFFKSEPKNNHRDQILYQFDKLTETLEIDGPKFVFSHILIPHDPYVFGLNCEFLGIEEVEKRSIRANYLNQLGCANKKIKALVNQLLSGSKETPIIIIQADEGPYPKNFNKGSNFSLKNTDRKTLEEKFGILNAYYLPNVGKSMLYNSITPVNSFRLVFNLYFGTDYKLLPDKSYIFEDINHLYKYTDVTERLNGL